jgi:hypothetical protein
MEHLETAKQIVASRHPKAVAAYWAGSLSRGEGTATSDIDVIVVRKHLQNAWRESFFVGDRLCETFVHDPRSLQVYFAQDTEQGRPPLLEMVAEGVSLIEGEMSERLQTEARRGLEAGPRSWMPDEVNRSRYSANDLLTDLAAADSPAEIRAIGASLFAHAFDHHRRINGRWSATAKHIVRALRREEGAFGLAYLSAFDKLFEDADPAAAIRLVLDIYASCGGPLAEWRSDAPPHR